jgi:carbon-monoxide dehydrogenase medium subunit
MAATPLRASAVEAAMADGTPAAEAAQLAAEGMNSPADTAASAEFRRHIARVLVGRALEEVSGRAS